MSAIQAAAVSCKTLSDGSLRLTVEIEPRHAIDAFTLFGSPGVPMALARLTSQGAVDHDRREQSKPKGGELAQLAGQMCKLPKFREFWWGGADHGEEQMAKEIRRSCDITSRSALDWNPDAAGRFNEIFLRPWQAFKRGQA